jgi:hypothetical protein
MFDSRLPLFTRGLSLFHGWLPLLLVWLLFRLGYDPRALTRLDRPGHGIGVRLLSLHAAPGTHLADPGIPINLNYIYGFSDRQPQTWIDQDAYVLLWLGVLWLVAYLPTHLLLRNFFAPRHARSA